MSFYRPFSQKIVGSGVCRSLSIIESTISYGLPSIPTVVPIHTRSELIKKLVSSGVSRIYAGNLNCNGPLFGTRDLLVDTKDIGYGERTVGASLLTPTMIGSFLSSGADELVIPVDLRFPFSVESSVLFKDSILLARTNGHTVRLQVDGICKSTEEDCKRLLEHFSVLGITHLSILDGEGVCTPSFLSLILHWVKDLIPKNRIALGFQTDSLFNVYTALEEGITSYHTCLGGLGNYTDTLRLIQFANEQGITIPTLDPVLLRKTDRWWKTQLSR